MSEYVPTMVRLRSEYVEMRAQHYGFSDLYAEEWDRAIAAHDAQVRYEAERTLLQKMAVKPPAGWSVFGAHVDDPDVDLEFYGESEDGLPLWERPAEAERTLPSERRRER